MEVRDATVEDLPAVLAIYNHAVTNTTAIWNDTPVDLDNRRVWLADRARQGYPVLVAVGDGVVLGYASFGDFRAFDGYRHTVEHSVYVHHDARRRGVARLLLEALIDRARGLGKHAMVAGIEAANEPSLALHAQLDFRRAGCLEQVGTKFGRWLDLVFMQRIL